MFDSLLSLIQAVSKGIWDAAVRAGVLVWGFIATMIATVVAAVNAFSDFIGDAAGYVTSAVLPSIGLSVPSELTSIIGLVNRIMPLTELMGYLIAWGALCGVLMLYHVVKSWLPTVSGS